MMIDDYGISREAISLLEATGKIKKTKETNVIVIFTFRNDQDPKMHGSIAVSPGLSDVFYLEVMGFTNKHFGRGEAIEDGDILEFINGAIDNEIQTYLTLFRRKRVRFGNITLNILLKK